MAWYPDAVKREINKSKKYGKLKKHEAIIYHVDAGGAETLFGWWNNPQSGAAGSHFFVKYDGTVEQYVDTDYLAWTSAAGSRRSIGIETAGKATGSWTAAQLQAIIKLTVWLLKTHPTIPARLMSSSKLSERGIGWHALGVPKNKTQKDSGVSQTGGELWSGSVGKVCPGATRIKQIPDIFKSVLTALNPLVPPVTPTAPGKPPVAPTTPSEQGVWHTVRKGETLSLIASRYKTTVAGLASFNKISNPNFIKTGQKIFIPNTAVITPVKPSTPTPTPVTTVRPSTTLKRGSRGVSVGNLQRGMNKTFPAYRYAVNVNKGSLLAVDNIFGPHLEAWVKEFQRRSKLDRDGIVGPLTIAALKRNGIFI